jgi:hypothetical protein
MKKKIQLILILRHQKELIPAPDMPILDGEDYNNNTVLSVDGGDVSGISYIYIQDIMVTNGRTGIAMDQADYVTLEGVEVYEVGQAGIHVRDESEYNIIKDSYVHDTGLYNVKYGGVRLQYG